MTFSSGLTLFYRLFVPRGTSIWFIHCVVRKKHAACSRSLCPGPKSRKNHPDPIPSGGPTRPGHGPHGSLLTSLNVCLRQLTRNRHDKSNAVPRSGCPDPGPVPPVRFDGCRGRGPRPTCYGLRRGLKVDSRGRFSSLSRRPLGKPRKHWGADMRPVRIGSGNAYHAKKQKLTAAE